MLPTQLGVYGEVGMIGHGHGRWLQIVAGSAVAITMASMGVAQAADASVVRAQATAAHAPIASGQRSHEAARTARANLHHMTLNAAGKLAPDSSVQAHARTQGPSARVRRIDTETALSAQRAFRARNARPVNAPQARRSNAEAMRRAARAWSAQQAATRRAKARAARRAAKGSRRVETEAAPAVDATGEVTGIVTDAASGNPLVSNCNIEIDVEDTSTFDDYSNSGCTDTAGKYTVTGVPAGTFTVSFYDRGDGYLTQYYDHAATVGAATTITLASGATKTGINAAMAPGATIAGTITDAATGNPLANNCSVEIDAENITTFNDYYENECTDSGGHYSVKGIPTGTYTVGFFDSQDGYLDQYYNGETSFDTADTVSVTAGSAATGIDAALVVGGTITGVITNAATGNPLANNCSVQVQVQNTVTFDDYYRSGCTNVAGAYAVGGLPTGMYTVEFSDAPDNLVTQYYDNETSNSSADDVSVTARVTTSGINAALAAGGTITGVITDATTGNPLANQCNFFIEIADASTGLEVSSAGCTDNTGAYKVAGLPSGSYKVYFQDYRSSDNYISQWYNGKPNFGAAISVTVSAGATTSGVSAALVKGGAITGTITAASTGSPLAYNCQVQVDAVNISTFSDYYRQACTDGAGGYMIGGLPTGTYTVEFYDYADDYVTQWYNAELSNGAADQVSVTAGTTTSGINAAMAAGTGADG